MSSASGSDWCVCVWCVPCSHLEPVETCSAISRRGGHGCVATGRRDRSCLAACRRVQHGAGNDAERARHPVHVARQLVRLSIRRLWWVRAAGRRALARVRRDTTWRACRCGGRVRGDWSAGRPQPVPFRSASARAGIPAGCTHKFGAAFQPAMRGSAPSAWRRRRGGGRQRGERRTRRRGALRSESESLSVVRAGVKVYCKKTTQCVRLPAITARDRMPLVRVWLV